MTYIISSDKWKIFSIRYTVPTEHNVLFIRFTQMSDKPRFTLYFSLTNATQAMMSSKNESWFFELELHGGGRRRWVSSTVSAQSNSTKLSSDRHHSTI